MTTELNKATGLFVVWNYGKCYIDPDPDSDCPSCERSVLAVTEDLNSKCDRFIAKVNHKWYDLERIDRMSFKAHGNGIHEDDVYVWERRF